MTVVRDGRGSLISDHALLRFMERVCGLNLDEWEALMNVYVDQAKDMGDGWLIDEGGFHYVTGEHGSIITVLTPEQGRRSRGFHARRNRK